MRKYLYASVLMLFIASCSKPANDIPSVAGSLVLAEVKQSNSATNTVNFRTCTYDRNGNLTYVSSTDKHGVQRGGYEISYPLPNTVVLKEWVEQFSVYENVITFILDGQGRPAARYQRQYLNHTSNGIWSIDDDSTFYNYGPDGLLAFSYSRSSDTVNAPGVNNLGVYRKRYADTTYFTNAGGDVVSARAVGKGSIIRYDGANTSMEAIDRRTTTTYDYSMQIKGGNYGKNAFLYQELNMLGMVPHPFHLHYQRIANKVSAVTEEQDRGNGQWTAVSAEPKQYNPGSVFNYTALNLITRVAYTEASSGTRYFSDFTYS
jgi:hypothetical protein